MSHLIPASISSAPALRLSCAYGVDLEPNLGTIWHNWVSGQSGINPDRLTEIRKRILELNEEIVNDASLGRHFQIGHSFVTPPVGVSISDVGGWFRQVIETEIGPLLEEYWFDDIEKARNSRTRLLKGF